MLCHPLIAIRHESADRRGRDAQERETVALNHVPNPIGLWKLGSALVQEGCGAKNEGAAKQPGAHHPAHIREPEHKVVTLYVEALTHVSGGLEWEARVGVHRPLRLSGGARRIDDHHRVIRRRVFGLARPRLVSNELVPPLVSPVTPGYVGATQSTKYHHVLNSWRFAHRDISRLFHGDHVAASIEAVRSDEHLSLAILKA